MTTSAKPQAFVWEEKPTPSCPHGQAELYERRWAQVEAMEEKVWPLAWCACCSGPALAPEDTDEWWSGVLCSRCRG